MKKRILQLCVVVALGFGTTANAQNSLTYTGPTTITAMQGETITLEYDYIFATDDGEEGGPFDGQVGIFASTDSSIFGGMTDSSLNHSFANPTFMQTTTAISDTFDLTIDAGATISADLPDGFNYYIFGKIDDVTTIDGNGPFDTSWQGAGYPILVVTAGTLNTNSFNVNGETSLYVKNSTKSLEIIKPLDETLSVYEITGRKVASIDARKVGSIDLTSLSGRMLIIKGDNSSNFLKAVF